MQGMHTQSKQSPPSNHDDLEEEKHATNKAMKARMNTTKITYSAKDVLTHM